MADEWTVVGSRGRPHKPRRSTKSVAGKPYSNNGSRGVRRSLEAMSDPVAVAASASSEAASSPRSEGGAINGGDDAAQPLPGWGSSGGGGGSGRAVRSKLRQAWTERTPEERVESLKRSVLDAKKDIEASSFYAALMAALRAADDANAGSDSEDAEHMEGGSPTSSARSDDADGAAANGFDRALGSGLAPRDDHSHSTGSGMAIDRSASGADAASQQPPHHRKQRRWRWANVQELVVYGLGSFESGPVPRCQLALTLLLAAGTPNLRMPPQLYDPAFTKVDKLLLEALGCQLIARNEQGRRVFGGSSGNDGGSSSGDGGASSQAPPAAASAAGVCRSSSSCGHNPPPNSRHAKQRQKCFRDAAVQAGDSAQRDGGPGGSSAGLARREEAGSSGGGGDAHAALVYLAHCKPELCDALLDANWTPAQLSSFAVIGNSMYTMAENWAIKSMRRVFAARPSRVLAAARARAVAETAVSEGSFAVTGAFNDMSLHVFSDPDVALLPDAGSDSD